MSLFNEKLIYLFEIKSSRPFSYIDVELKTKVSRKSSVSVIRVDMVNDVCGGYRSDRLVYTEYQRSIALHHFDPEDGNGGDL